MKQLYTTLVLGVSWAFIGMNHSARADAPGRGEDRRRVQHASRPVGSADRVHPFGRGTTAHPRSGAYGGSYRPYNPFGLQWYPRSRYYYYYDYPVYSPPVYYVPSEPPVYEAQPVPRVRHETPPPQVIAKVAQVQENLRKAGYYKGTVDGLMGPATKSAIRSYQVEKGLPVTGLIDKELLLDLGL